MSQTFPPVRLVALDLDGTLLNHEGQVTPRTRAALLICTQFSGHWMKNE